MTSGEGWHLAHGWLRGVAKLTVACLCRRKLDAPARRRYRYGRTRARKFKARNFFIAPTIVLWIVLNLITN